MDPSNKKNMTHFHFFATTPYHRNWGPSGPTRPHPLGLPKPLRVIHRKIMERRLDVIFLVRNKNMGSTHELFFNMYCRCLYSTLIFKKNMFCVSNIRKSLSNPFKSYRFQSVFPFKCQTFFSKNILGLREDVELEVGFLHEVAILTGKGGLWCHLSGFMVWIHVGFFCWNMNKQRVSEIINNMFRYPKWKYEPLNVSGLDHLPKQLALWGTKSLCLHCWYLDLLVILSCCLGSHNDWRVVIDVVNNDGTNF